MPNQLKKILGLTKKTGDRIIVFDQEDADGAYIVMPLDDYEKIAVGKSEVRGLTEDELLDKINRDIAIWKSEQEFKGNKGKIINRMDFEGDFGRDYGGDYRDFLEPEDLESEDEDCWEDTDDESDQKFPYIKDFESEEPENAEKKGRIRGNNWVIPRDRKEAAEEIIEEDRQYLERVDF